jgi:phosphoserine phosphatase
MSSSAAAPERGQPLRGVVFDMDGTLTVPAIDFQAVHREVLGGDAAYAAAREAGGGSVDILHYIESWAPDLQRGAYDVIARFEREGLDRLQIMPGELAACGCGF